MTPEQRKQKFVERLDKMIAATEKTMQGAKNSMPAEYRGFMDERISLLNQQKQRFLKNIDIYLIGNELSLMSNHHFRDGDGLVF